MYHVSWFFAINHTLFLVFISDYRMNRITYMFIVLRPMFNYYNNLGTNFFFDLYLKYMSKLMDVDNIKIFVWVFNKKKPEIRTIL